MQVWSPYNTGISKQEKEPENTQNRFRTHFTLELTRCARKHLSIAESFGLVFDQTLDRIHLDEDEQGHLYRELLTWAKQSAELFPSIHSTYSPQMAGKSPLPLGHSR